MDRKLKVGDLVRLLVDRGGSTGPMGYSSGRSKVSLPKGTVGVIEKSLMNERRGAWWVARALIDHDFGPQVAAYFGVRDGPAPDLTKRHQDLNVMDLWESATLIDAIGDLERSKGISYL